MLESEQQIMELQTVQFLRDNDPFFHCKNQLTHSYHSHRTTKSRRSKEIPSSNLSKRQMRRCPKMYDSFDVDELNSH